MFFESLYYNQILFAIILLGFIHYIQPLDIYVNKKFKLNIKEKYINILFIKNEEFSINKEILIKWVTEIWKSDNIIKNEVIFIAFKKAEISNKINRLEDDLLIYPEELYNFENDNIKESNFDILKSKHELINYIDDDLLKKNDNQSSSNSSDDDPYYTSNPDSDSR